MAKSEIDLFTSSEIPKESDPWCAVDYLIETVAWIGGFAIIVNLINNCLRSP